MINEAPWKKKKEEQTSPRKDAAMERERGSSAPSLRSLWFGSLRRGEQPSGTTPWGARSRSGRRRTGVLPICLGCLRRGEEQPRSKRPAAAAAAAANGWSAGANLGQQPDNTCWIQHLPDRFCVLRVNQLSITLMYLLMLTKGKHSLVV